MKSFFFLLTQVDDRTTTKHIYDVPIRNFVSNSEQYFAKNLSGDFVQYCTSSLQIIVICFQMIIFILVVL